MNNTLFVLLAGCTLVIICLSVNCFFGLAKTFPHETHKTSFLDREREGERKEITQTLFLRPKLQTETIKAID